MSLFIFSAVCSALLVFLAIRFPPSPTRAANVDAFPEASPVPSANVNWPVRPISEKRRPVFSAKIPVGFWILVFIIAITFVTLLWSAAQQSRYDVKFVSSMLDFIRDSDNGEVLFGFLFGIFFAIWFNALLARESNEPFQYRDAVIAGLLVLFLILGAGGRGFLSQLLARVTDVKLAGAEVSLSHGKDEATSETSHYTLVPPQNKAQAVNAPDTSGGLQMLRDIPGAIRRDALYYALSIGTRRSLAGQPAKDIESLNNALDLANKMQFEYVVECLQKNFALHADADELGRELSVIARRIRSIAYLNTGNVEEIETDFRKLQDSISDYKKLKCDRAGRPGLAQDEATPKYEANLVEHLRLRPYLWIAAASGLAYYHDYAAALKVLDDWIRAAEGTCPGKDAAESIFPQVCNQLAAGISKSFSKELIQIFKLRVRTLMASYVEEWNNYQPVSKTLPVLRYHTENLEEGIKLEPLLIKVPLAPLGDVMKINFASKTDAAGDCTKFQGDWDDWPSVFKKFVKNDPADKNLTVPKLRLAQIVTIRSLKQDWLQAAQDQPEIFEEKKSTAIQYADDLVRDNLFCLSLLKDEPEGDEGLQPGKGGRDGQAAKLGGPEQNEKIIKSSLQSEEPEAQPEKSPVQPEKGAATKSIDEGTQYVILQRSQANYYFAQVLLRRSEDWANEISTSRLALLKHGLQGAQSALLDLRPFITSQGNYKRNRAKAFLEKISSTQEIEFAQRLQDTVKGLTALINKS